MKKLSIIFLLLTFFSIGIDNVLAECTDDELILEREKANNMEFRYELQDPTTGAFGEVVYGIINLYIDNMPEGFTVVDADSKFIYDSSYIVDGVADLGSQSSGTYEFKIYGNKCDQLLKTVTIKIPKFNWHSEDPLCENISGKELSVCDPWYENNYDYDTFAKIVKEYNESLNGDKLTFLDKFVNFISDYSVYIISSIILIIIVVSIIVINKKRGELK